MGQNMESNVLVILIRKLSKFSINLVRYLLLLDTCTYQNATRNMLASKSVKHTNVENPLAFELYLFL